MKKNNSYISQKIYNNIYKFLKQEGYISELQRYLKIPEQKRFNKKNISKIGLDILDAVHCVTDKKRSLLLLEEVTKTVKPGNLVLEAGIGTGILSFGAFTSESKIIGIEINKKIIILANKIKDFFSKKNPKILSNISFIYQDAIKYKPTTPVDVIISENLYTGMFYEKQIEIMNNLVEYLRPTGKVIPRGFKMGINLIETKFPYNPKGQEMFVPLELRNKIKIKNLTKDVVYSTLSFQSKNSLWVDQILKIKIQKNGIINSVLIWSEVLLNGKKKIGRKDTTFLNNDIIISLKKPLQVKQDEFVFLKLKYKYGTKPQDAIISVYH